MVIDGLAYFTLTSRQYENLSKNMAELYRWTKEAAWLLGYYTEDK